MPETEYWKKAEEGLTIADYPEVEEGTVRFPEEIHVAYAVCTKECGAAEFIVDGSSQICDRCGRTRFRSDVRKYVLSEE